MLERDDYPAGVPCWIDSTQPDPDAAVEFYAGLFGWDLRDQMPAEAPGHYYVARLRGRDVAAIGSAAGDTAVWNTYIRVDDADETADGVRVAGGSVRTEPFDVLDAGRMAVCADPGGAEFSLWQPGTRRGAQIVNEPGTWNWSDLNTRDVEAAKRFYASVFGWEAGDVDLGFGPATMVRVPGYAEFLERYDPGLRGRHAEAGVPEGFSDSICWMMPMSPDQFPEDALPHWHVTFSVDDTDATTERAVELGGAVVTPVFDAGPVRMAVVRDPQGAVFTISRYHPEQ
jgi:predicted enzyme related to lactoylglutathione lyase